MSTIYYALRPPFTRLSVTDDYGDCTIHVEIKGSPAGELRCSKEQLGAVVNALTDDEYAGTAEVLVKYMRDLPDSRQLISEYGDLTTIGELRRGVAP